MLQVPGRGRAFALLIAVMAVPAMVGIAQQGPVGAMFESDKARDPARLQSAGKARTKPARCDIRSAGSHRPAAMSQARPR